MEREEFLKKIPELVAVYQPASEVLAHINNLTLFMVVGPSGGGKTSIIQRSNLIYVPADTTREPRPGERDGADYHFRTDYTQIMNEMKAGSFVQVAIGPTGDFYATRDSSYPKAGVIIIAVISDVVPIFRNLGFKKTITGFITPPTYDEWIRRLGSHDLSGDKLEKRLVEGKRSFTFALNDEQTHVILNDDLEKASLQAANLVLDSVDEEREAAGKEAAAKILAKLESLEVE